MNSDRKTAETRVLVVALTAKDAALAEPMLEQGGVTCHICKDIRQVCEELEGGAGALLLPEEDIVDASQGELASWIERQPAWSDLPILVISRQGADSPAISRAMDLLGNVTVLERPMRVAAFISAVRAALRARHRQYQIREYLKERREAEEQLKNADTRKDEFLAMLAHELRNPLAPMRNALALLEHNVSHHAEGHCRRILQRQLAHMTRLIDDLLDVSRITRGKIKLKLEPMEMAGVVRDAVETARAACEDKDLSVSLNLPAEPVYVLGDATRLSQIISNLLNNACKFTERGGQIELTAQLGDGVVAVHVRDSGIGIAKDQLARIFEWFAQVNTSLERSQGGLGIGLSLAKQLVELHGGSISAMSEGPGRGSEFVVRLPTITVIPAAPPAPSHDALPANRSGRRVLVVDDNQDSADSLAKLLKLLGNETCVALDGLQAIHGAETFRPDVVLLDIGLPKMNGYDVCRSIREKPWGQTITMVALTGWGQEEHRSRSAEAGFDSHLVKPVDLDLLSDLLARSKPSGSTTV
ncbi:MAG TPA: ATP-binding protein [Phycisphaerae bacterium]|nr:ATP-binding protein [Phycisphaerae bacterium]